MKDKEFRNTILRHPVTSAIEADPAVAVRLLSILAWLIIAYAGRMGI